MHANRSISTLYSYVWYELHRNNCESKSCLMVPSLPKYEMTPALKAYIHTPLIFCAFQPGVKVKVNTKLTIFESPVIYTILHQFLE